MQGKRISMRQWFHSSVRGDLSPRKARRGRGGARFRPEALEPRCLLSTTYFVDDDWIGSTQGAIVGGDKTFGVDAFSTIQAAINKATSGDLIRVAAGTYPGTLVVNKSLTVTGDGSETVEIDVTAGATANAISVTASDVSLSGFTLQGSTANGVVRYGINASGATSNLSFEDIVVRETSRTGVNLHGVSTVILTGVEVHDTTGAGLFFTDVKGATLSDLATSGNSWGGLGFSTYGRYYPIGVDDVVIQGTNSFGEVDSDNGGMYFEESRYENGGFVLDDPEPITFSTDPADGANVTILSENFAYAISGPQTVADNWPVRYRFFDTLTQAEDAVDGDPTHFLPEGRVLFNFSGFDDPRTFHVESLTNRTMSIQAAIDFAEPGDAVRIGAGTFGENVVVDRRLTITGVGSGDDPGSNTILQAAGGNIMTFETGGDSAVDPLVVRDLRVAGADGGFSFDGAVSHVRLDRVEAVGNADHGVAIQDAAIVGDLILTDVTLSGSATGLLVGPTASVDGLSITDSHFDGNTYGLAAYASEGSTTNQDDFTNIVITGTTFNANTLMGIYAEKLDEATFDGIMVNASGTSGVGSAGIALLLKHGDYANIVIRNSAIINNGSGDPSDGSGLSVGALSSGPFGTNPATLDGLTLAQNVITGNRKGVLIGTSAEDAGPTGVAVHFNRLSGNGAVNLAVSMEGLAAAQVDASNNWWGSNSGAGTTAVGGALVSPYLVLKVSASPSSTLVGTSAAVTADLTRNSDDIDTSALGLVPDGPLSFGATLGQINPNVTTLAGGKAAATFTAGAVVGTATLSATFDGVVATASQQVVGPTLSLAGPSTVNQGAPYILSMVAGVDAGAIAGWTINWGDGTVDVIVGDPGSATHTYAFTPDQYVISATATNTLGTYQANNTITIDVLNVAPVVAIAGAPSSLDQGQLVSLVGVVTDPGGGPFTYAWTATLDGEVVASGDQPEFSFTPIGVGEHVVTLAVTDANGGTGSQGVVIESVDLEPTAVITGAPIAPMVGNLIELQGNAQSPIPGATLTYEWTLIHNGVVIAQGSDPNFAFTPSFSGSYLVQLTVADGEGRSTTSTVTITAASSIPPTVEVLLEADKQRLDRMIERQDRQIALVLRRFGENPPPRVRQLIRQVERQQLIQQVLFQRRLDRLQRFFELRSR